MRMRRKQLLSEAEINLTPLIDVCFVILIMFIVVAPLLETERIELAGGPPLEQSNVWSAQEKSQVTLHVYSDDSIDLNREKITLSQLKEALVLAKKRHPLSKPQVFHDRNAKFGTYHKVKNMIEAAGFTEMDVILKPE